VGAGCVNTCSLDVRNPFVALLTDCVPISVRNDDIPTADEPFALVVADVSGRNS
jgi:hypothetical protein